MPQATTFTRYPLQNSRQVGLRAWHAAGVAAVLVAALWLMGASSGNGDGLATFGNWTVYRSSQPDAEGGHCYAVHSRYGAVRLLDNSLVITLPETPRGYRYQVDSNSLSTMKLVSLGEQQPDRVDLVGKAFAELESGHHVHIDIVTFTKVLEVDMNLDGIAETLGFLATAPACAG